MNTLIGQSGGPTSVINSSLAGAIQASIDLGAARIYGMRNGIVGLLEENFVEFDQDIFIQGKIAEKLKQRPSSILGSCRYKLPEDLNHEIYEKIFAILRKMQVDIFLYIGGNDSMDTVVKLNAYMKKEGIEDIYVLGCPKTIDNDLMGMDHSPGYGSSAKYIAQVCQQIKIDSAIYPIESVTIVEIMGRNAGWLTAASLLANRHRRVVDLIYLGEDRVSRKDILEDVKDAVHYNQNIVIALSEGFMDMDGYFLKEDKRISEDDFNHPVISGIGQRLADYIHDQLGLKTRSVELNILQRTTSMVSRVDIEEAYELGYRAICLGGKKITAVLPVIRRISNKPYQVSYDYLPVADIANKEKKIPEDWLQSKKLLKEKIIDYAGPLIEGEIDHVYKEGIISYIDLKDFTKS